MCHLKQSTVVEVWQSYLTVHQNNGYREFAKILFWEKMMSDIQLHWSHVNRRPWSQEEKSYPCPLQRSVLSLLNIVISSLLQFTMNTNYVTRSSNHVNHPRTEKYGQKIYIENIHRKYAQKIYIENLQFHKNSETAEPIIYLYYYYL